MSRMYKTTAVTEGEMTALERRRRNHPVFDVGRTVERTYRDLLVFGERGATMTELHAEGFCRFTAAVRRAAIQTLVSLGHVEPVDVVRTFAATSTHRRVSRHVTIYRLTPAGTICAEANLTDNDRLRLAARREYHINKACQPGS